MRIRLRLQPFTLSLVISHTNYSMTSQSFAKQILYPLLQQRIDVVDAMYISDKTERKHLTKALPFDALAMLDEIIEKGSEAQINYIVITYALSYCMKRNVPDLTINNCTDYFNITDVMNIILENK